jgi:hypothetical protein|tara:strand:- start:2168 stop:3154 length:987 start_codon:yes stop_codon:yes gene_type:complete
MGPLAQFLLALTNLVRSGAIRKIPQAIKFAEQQFGKVTPLLKKQIEKVFETAKKPVVGKPGKKEGAVIPMVKEVAKKEEGIASLEDNSPLMDELDQTVDMLQKNPRRPGGALDPATGITRALARRILDKKGIEIGKKDPIEVFMDTFGEAISDVNNLAEEMVEADKMGRNLKSPDELLEIEGLFDIEIPTNPQKGLTDDELLELIKKTEEEEVLKDFDPTDRKPNATGGRIGFQDGTTPTFEEYLKERETIEKQRNLERLMYEFEEDMRRKKVMDQKQMVSAPDPMDELNNLSQMLFKKNLDELTEEERDMLREYESKNMGLPNILKV